MLFAEISVKDKNGYPVENANNRVHISVEGAGALAGTDNGDSTDTDGYKDYSRRLFSGKLLAVCKAGCRAGSIEADGYCAGTETCGRYPYLWYRQRSEKVSVLWLIWQGKI